MQNQPDPLSDPPDLEELHSDLSPVIKNFNKKEFLEWVTAASLYPGNELYIMRFMYLKYVALSISEEEYKGRDIQFRLIQQILDKLEGRDWEVFEIYDPIPNDQKNRFEFQGEIYNFLAPELLSPELTLKECVTKHLPLDNGEIYPYSVEEEFEKLLKYQNEIHQSIQGSPPPKETYLNVRIPPEEFIQEISGIVHNPPEFSQDLWSPLTKAPPPSSLLELNTDKPVRDLFVLKPILGDGIYTPNTLIESFIKALESDLEDTPKPEYPSDHLRDHITRETLHAVSEIVNSRCIFLDVSISDIDESFDYCVIVDDQLLMIECIEHKPDSESYESEMERVGGTISNLDHTISLSEVELNESSKGSPPNNKLRPLVLVVTDNLNPSAVKILNPDLRSVVIGYPDLYHLCWRIAELDLTLFDLIKSIALYLTNHDLLLSPFSLADSFEMMYGDDRDLLQLSHNPERENYYVSSDKQRMKIRNKRPMLDLRPPGFDIPYFFQIIEMSDKDTFHGYNHLIEAEFFCLRKPSDYYITYSTFNKTYTEKDILRMISQFILSYLSRLQQEDMLGDSHSKYAIHLFSEDQIPNANIPEKDILISGEQEDAENILGIIFDIPSIFNESDNNSRHPRSLLTRLIPELPEILQEVSPQKMPDDVVKDMLKASSEDFGFTKVSAFHQNEPVFTSRPPGEPTKIDEYRSAVELINRFEDEIDYGTYSGEEGKEVAKKIFEYLHDELQSSLREYDYNYFVKFAYRELENSTSQRKTLAAGLASRKVSSKIGTHTTIDEYVEAVGKGGSYATAIRYLIEEATSLNISGDREIPVIEWQKLVATAEDLILVSSVNDYLSSLKDSDSLSAEFSFTPAGISSSFFYEDGPIHNYLRTSAEDIKQRSVDEVIPELGIEDDEEINTSDITDDYFNTQLNQAFNESYGFKLSDYTASMDVFYQLHSYMDERGVITIPREELVERLETDSGMSSQTAENIIEFLRLDLQDEEIEPWKIDSRTRMSINPILETEDGLIFAPEALSSAEQLIFEEIQYGNWLPPGNPPDPIDKILEKIQKDAARALEDMVRDKVEKSSSYTVQNLCVRRGENDDILRNISEDCPGEMDVVSIHENKKELVIWEAKNIPSKYGPREIGNTLEKYTKEDGQMERLKEKEEYLRRHLGKILETYNPTNLDSTDADDWEVNSYFVLPEGNTLLPFFNEDHPTVYPSDIEEYTS